MAFDPEDGSIVPTAVTYVTVDEAKLYASRRGVTLPADDGAVEVLLTKAMDFIEAREGQFAGSRVSAAQPLSWPRTGLTLNGFAFPTDEIPQALKSAQSQLAIDAMTMDLAPTSTGRVVKRQKVDVIETEYALTDGALSGQPELTKALALLSTLFDGGGYNLTVPIMRV